MISIGLMMSPVTRNLVLRRVFGEMRSSTQLWGRARRDAEILAEMAGVHRDECAKLVARLEPARAEYQSSRRKLLGALRELDALDTRLAHDVERNAGLLVRIGGLPRAQDVPTEKVVKLAEANRRGLGGASA